LRTSSYAMPRGRGNPGRGRAGQGRGRGNPGRGRGNPGRGRGADQAAARRVTRAAARQAQEPQADPVEDPAIEPGNEAGGGGGPPPGPGGGEGSGEGSDSGSDDEDTASSADDRRGVGHVAEANMNEGNGRQAAKISDLLKSRFGGQQTYNQAMLDKFKSFGLTHDEALIVIYNGAATPLQFAQLFDKNALKDLFGRKFGLNLVPCMVSQ